MMGDLAELLEITEPAFAVFALVFLRVGAMMALLPAFGEQAVPMRIKLGASLAFTMIVGPAMVGQTDPLPVDARILGAAGAEVIAGLALGILFRLFVLALQIAGTIAGQSTSLAQIFGAGLGAEPQPAFSTLFVIAGLCLAVMAGLHVHIAGAMISSYEVFPLGRLISSAELGEWGVQKIADCFNLGLSLSGPFILVSVVYNLGLGVINKAMPQLMVAFVGAPAISIGGLIMLMIASPFILSIWLKAFLNGTDMFGGAF